MLFLLYTAIVLSLILLGRILVDDAERRKWQKALPCLSNPDNETSSSNSHNRRQRTSRQNQTEATTPPQEEQNEPESWTFSKEEDTFIRKTILSKRLEAYTMTLTASHTSPPRSRTHTSTTLALSDGASDDAFHLEPSSSDVEDSENIPETKKSCQEEPEGELPMELPTVQRNESTQTLSEDGSVEHGLENHPSSLTKEDLMECGQLEDTHCQIKVLDDVEESIFLPPPGTKVDSLNGRVEYRPYANSCSICLCHFDKDEQVTWSSNSQCTHVFHSDCIQNWLMTAGYKHYKRQARQFRKGKISTLPDQLQSILTAPMECPNCRDAFLTPDANVDSEALSSLQLSNLLLQNQSEIAV